MSGEEIIAKVWRNDWMGTLSIGFMRKSGGHTYIARPVEIVFDEVIPENEYAAREPFLRLYWPEGQQLLQAFAEAIDEAGIKTDSDAKIAGTLDATRFHLEDLRTMLKLNKRTEAVKEVQR